MFSFVSSTVRTSLIRDADQCLDYLQSCCSKQMPFSQNCYCSCRLGGLWTKKHRRPITYLTALFHFLDTHPFFCQALGDLKSAVKAGGPWLQRTRAGWDWGWLSKKKGIYIYIYIDIYTHFLSFFFAAKESAKFIRSFSLQLVVVPFTGSSMFSSSLNPSLLDRTRSHKILKPYGKPLI